MLWDTQDIVGTNVSTHDHSRNTNALVIVFSDLAAKVWDAVALRMSPGAVLSPHIWKPVKMQVSMYEIVRQVWQRQVTESSF